MLKLEKYNDGLSVIFTTGCFMDELIRTGCSGITAFVIQPDGGISQHFIPVTKTKVGEDVTYFYSPVSCFPFFVCNEDINNFEAYERMFNEVCVEAWHYPKEWLYDKERTYDNFLATTFDYNYKYNN